MKWEIMQSSEETNIQTAYAYGTLLCKGKAAAGVTVWGMERDKKWLPDDYLNKTKSDRNGNFNLTFHTKEVNSATFSLYYTFSLIFNN